MFFSDHQGSVFLKPKRFGVSWRPALSGTYTGSTGIEGSLLSWFNDSVLQKHCSMVMKSDVNSCREEKTKQKSAMFETYNSRYLYYNSILKIKN